VQTSRADAAEGEFQTAVQVEPGNRDARFVLASFYLVNKRYNKLKRLTRRWPNSTKTNRRPFGARRFLRCYRPPDEAIAIYKEVVANAPTTRKVVIVSPNCSLNHGDLKNAAAASMRF
jgi:hypothetical protein